MFSQLFKMSDRKIKCCLHGDHINCPNFKKYGYNCADLDNEFRWIPSGNTIGELFEYIIKLGVNGYGPCYCDNADKPCNCGRIKVDNKIYVAEWSDYAGWVNWKIHE
jgi:hypothetical protein